jgi:hypothetical protein
MSKFGFVEVPITQQIDGTALASSSTATSILAPASKFTLPANYFDAAGKAIRITAGGRVSTVSATPGTLTFDIRLGSVVVFNGGASGTVVTSASNLTWLLEAVLTCRSIGSSTSATILGIGKLTSAVLSATVPIMLLPTSSPAAGTGFDSTAASVLDLFATWSVNNASNSIRCDMFQVELLN